jgi:betaine reductase
VYHIVEQEVKDSVDPSVYEDQVGVMDVALEKDKISEALDKVRAKS